MRTRFYTVFTTIILMIFAPLHAADPGTPRLQQTAFETADHVIVTHHAWDYGVIPDDGQDDTAALQQAIDACHEDGGGVVFIPGGRYHFSNNLILKSTVHLRGEWRSPEYGPSSDKSTIFCITYGRDTPDAQPFIALNSSCGLKDLAFWYPEQDHRNPTPYAWTLQQITGMSVGLENLTFYNTWQGLQTGPRHNQLLTGKNIYMTALHIGFMRDSIYDCQKFQKIFMRPTYWAQSGLPGAPTTQTEQDALQEFLHRESIGALIRHYDWTWMYDWTIEGFHTGIKTTKSLVRFEGHRGPNGGFTELRLINNRLGIEISDINRAGWADTNVMIHSDYPGAIGIKVLKDLKSVAQFINITFTGSFQYCVLSESSYGCVMLSGCTFEGWASDGYAVSAPSGVIQLIQNSFKQDGNHIYIGDKITGAAILGNSFNGPASITNDAPDYALVSVDHTPLDLPMCDLSQFEYPEAIYKPANPAIFDVRDFGATGDSVTDDSAAFTDALTAAKENGGGTVYVPVGNYLLNHPITIPTGIELRGIFDNNHHTMDIWAKLGEGQAVGQKGSQLWVTSGKGDADGTPAINLETGSSLRGITIFHPEQTWDNYTATEAFTPYPWTIQSRGPQTRLKDVVLVNSYQGADFGTYDSTEHNIDYLCGTVLKTGLYVDNCFGQGFVKNVQWNPSFWAWGDYENRPEKSSCDLLRDVVKHTLTAFVFGYSEQQNTLHTFSFGSRVGIHFINNPQHGGVNGTFIAHGIDHCCTSMIFDDVGHNAKFVGFQMVSMDVQERRHFLDIGENVQGRAEFYNLLGWGHDPCADIGIEMKSGDFYFLLTSLASFGLEYGIKQTGGSFQAAGFRFGEGVNADIFGGYSSGLYGYFSDTISKADLIGVIKHSDVPEATAFTNESGDKLQLRGSTYHIGY